MGAGFPRKKHHWGSTQGTPQRESTVLNFKKYNDLDYKSGNGLHEGLRNIGVSKYQVSRGFFACCLLISVCVFLIHPGSSVTRSIDHAKGFLLDMFFPMQF